MTFLRPPLKPRVATWDFGAPSSVVINPFPVRKGRYEWRPIHFVATRVIKNNWFVKTRRDQNLFSGVQHYTWGSSINRKVRFAFKPGPQISYRIRLEYITFLQRKKNQQTNNNLIDNYLSLLPYRRVIVSKY